MKVYIISPKGNERFIHKSGIKFYYFYSKGKKELGKATFYKTDCNQLILKHQFDKTVFYQRFGNLPFRELSEEKRPIVTWSKNVLANKYSKEYPLCPKCFPIGEKDL